MRWVGACALLLSLSACNAFDFGLQDDPATTKWERKKTSEEQTASDLRACRSQANAVLDRDAQIDQSVESTHDTGSGANAATDLQTNMNAYSHKQKYREIVNDCMRGRGYSLPQN
jgi:hypothetical protein